MYRVSMGNHSYCDYSSDYLWPRKIVNKVILYCEGRNTEPSFFELLKKNNCKVVPVIVPGHGIGSCIEFVEEANKKYNCLPRTQRDKYRQKWLMYDYDGHEDFAASIKIARQNGFRVTLSNMCIEYWFLFHFYNLDGQPIPMKNNSHSQALETFQLSCQKAGEPWSEYWIWLWRNLSISSLFFYC